MARVQAPAMGRNPNVSVEDLWKIMETYGKTAWIQPFMVEFGESFTLMTNINAGFVGYNMI